MRKAPRVFLFFLAFSLCRVWSEYPEIKSLKSNDILYVQLQKDIERYYKAVARLDYHAVPKLTFFTYKVRKNDTLFSLAAKLNIPYDTIASLNRISQAAEFSACPEIIIPNVPGIFVPLHPNSAIEEIMYSWRMGNGIKAENIVVSRNGSGTDYLFFCGDKFHTVERAYFLRILFRFPLDHVVITSGFGVRSDPFTGHPTFHNGIDLAAPVGTSVYAVREGTVVECGCNEWYGNYVKICHPGGYETLYGHLRDYSVCAQQKIAAGTRIGSVGLTGKTTGPHLHFEIIKDGKRVDPNSLLPEKQHNSGE